MNWDALAAIGEILGAAGVIVTLGYLAIQIRQNTKAIRGSTLNAVTQHQQYELRWSAEIGSSMRKAIHTPDQMSEDDVWQVSEWVTAALITRQNEFSQFQQGLLDQERWSQSEGVIRIIAGMEWTAEWWQSYGKDNFTSDFAQYVEGILEEQQLTLAEKMAELGAGGGESSAS